MSIRCIIADDEPIARQIVERYVSQLPQLELVALCGDAFEVMEVLQKEKVDLLFLDINMPNLSGISLIRSLRVRPEIILTTAYSEFALEGFELAVTDYLLKPFSLERFIMAVNKVQDKITPPSVTTSTPNDINLQQTSIPTHITVKVDKKLLRLALEEIRYVEAFGNYIKIYVSDNMYLVSQTLTEFLGMLPGAHFIRIHKSYVIHYQYVRAIDGNRVFVEDTSLPLGKTFKEELMKRIRNESQNM